MIDVYTMTLAVCGILQTDETLGNITFTPAYTARNKPFPLVIPTVAVGCESFKEKKGEVYSKPDENGDTYLLYNRATDVRVCFDICVSQDVGGTMCYYIFNKIGQKLMENDTLYNYVGAGCGDIKYQRDINAHILRGWVDIEIRRIV